MSPTTLDHSETIIDVRDVSFAYGTHEVLRHASLAIHRGDYFAIVGGNGSGKTTLLKIMLGLLSRRDGRKGSVFLFGTPVEQFTDWQKIGYVSQRATQLEERFPVSVLDVVLMGRIERRGLGRWYSREDYAKAREALGEVGMSDFETRLVRELSGGEQQRVFIARALAGEPEVLLLDEPTVGVDDASKKEFYQLLRTLNKDRGLAVVLITHDLEDVAHEAMHVACVDKSISIHEEAKQLAGQRRGEHTH